MCSGRAYTRLKRHLNINSIHTLSFHKTTGTAMKIFHVKKFPSL